MGQLVFCRDGSEVLLFPLTSDTVSLGRHAENDISLPDLEVSRFHAKLSREKDSYRLDDLSRNGITMGGVAIESVLLCDADVFEIGPWRIFFEQHNRLDDSETIADEAKPSHSALGNPTLFHGMVGTSEVMQDVFSCIQKVAPSCLPVLVHGETGTGKELVAQALHHLSKRQGSFIAINCGAISPQLIESELFGHERGAFTGAVTQHRGAFETAHLGSLFLDEIGELPLELQAKLLRILEEGKIRRVGGTHEVAVDVRVVAATHRDLQTEVSEGRFREDLYYRLLGILIHLPPLRERKEDIPYLARHFLEQGSPDKCRRELAEDAVRRLQAHAWPGNIREMRNVLARSLVFCERQVLGAPDLRFVRLQTFTEKPSLEGAERDAIMAALQATHGNKSQAADRLGIAKSTLFRKLREYGLSDYE